MATTRRVRHENYDLQCGARPVDGGRFAPVLVVASVAWPNRPRTIAVKREVYADEAGAVDAACAQGIEWVAHHG